MRLRNRREGEPLEWGFNTKIFFMRKGDFSLSSTKRERVGIQQEARGQNFSIHIKMSVINA